MIRRLMRIRRKRVLMDVDTQKDYLVASGADCIRNHRRVLVNIRRMMAWAKSKNTRIISTMLVSGSDGEADHGNDGESKISYTMMKSYDRFVADGSTDLPINILHEHQQIIFNKRSIDPFVEPRIERLLTEVRPDEFVVIGTSTEGAVKATVLGLLQRGKHVSVVVDAVGSQNKKAAEMALRQMQAKGAKLIETKKIAGVSHLMNASACGCERCRGLMRKDAVSTSAN